MAFSFNKPRSASEKQKNPPAWAWLFNVLEKLWIFAFLHDEKIKI